MELLAVTVEQTIGIDVEKIDRALREREIATATRTVRVDISD